MPEMQQGELPKVPDCPSEPPKQKEVAPTSKASDRLTVAPATFERWVSGEVLGEVMLPLGVWAMLRRPKVYQRGASWFRFALSTSGTFGNWAR